MHVHVQYVHVHVFDIHMVITCTYTGYCILVAVGEGNVIEDSSSNRPRKTTEN